MIHFTVKCPDGAFRHQELFPDRVSAYRFADHGHCCVAASAHTIQAHDLGSGDFGRVELWTIRSEPVGSQLGKLARWRLYHGDVRDRAIGYVDNVTLEEATADAERIMGDWIAPRVLLQDPELHEDFATLVCATA